MGDEWKAIVESYKQMIWLYKDIARLLEVFQDLVGEHGWRPVGDNTCLAEHSDSLKNADNWLPYFAFRTFQNTEHPRIIIFVSVILYYRHDQSNDGHDQPESHFQRPLVTSGLFEYGKAIPDKKKFGRASRGLCLHLYTPDKDYEGAFFTTKPKFFDDLKDSIPDLVCARTMARPLEQITDRDDLQKLILEPLLKEVESHKESIGR